MRHLDVQPFNHDEMLAGVAEEREKYGDQFASFHRAFYASKWTHTLTNWMGLPILKNPLDVWVFQEVIYHQKPTLIIETGTAYGGSALFFAHMLDRRGDPKSRVISIDVEPNEQLPTAHPRLTFMKADSTDPEIVQAVGAIAAQHERVMVILDSDHSETHVAKELACYAPMVSPGQYLVVEDTHYNGRPVLDSWMGGPGPGPAVDAWLPSHPEFVPDISCERFMMTFYPGGWLRRVA